jgi:predicted transcriptional regulator
MDVTGMVDGTDLLSMELADHRVVLDGLITEGTTIVASAPKTGKSWLMYQLAVEAALGGEMLGRRVTRCRVLLLALEDGPKRGQGRLRKTLRDRKLPRGWLMVQWQAEPLGDGLEEYIVSWLDRSVDAEKGEMALIIVDTLGRVRGEKVGDVRRNAYAVDVRDLGMIQSLIQQRGGVALIIVHHTNKGRDEDFVARVSGSYGIAGSADTVIELQRRRTETEGKLLVTSRELSETETVVRLDVERMGGWVLAPDAIPGASATRRAVWEMLYESEEPLGASAIARETGAERSTVQHMLREMEEDGIIRKVRYGRYLATQRLSEFGGKIDSKIGEKVGGKSESVVKDRGLS